MLFSIIIPMYNVEKYIENCIDSIVNQEFTDYELILVDDGSTDRTVDIAKKNISKSHIIHSVHLIRKENSGASDSRNLGLKYATGKYIVFMDSDDTMLPEALEVMAKASKSDQDLYVFSLKKRKDEEILESTLTQLVSFSIKKEKSLDVLEEYLKRTNFKITWQPWAKLFKREIIETNNVQFDSRLHSCNDFNFFFSYFLFVHSVEFVNTPTVIYTVDREGSISTTKTMRRLNSNTFAYAKFFDDIDRIDDTKECLLDYASHLFLCALDLCANISEKELKIIKSLVAEHMTVYKYSKRKTSILKRGLFRVFGLKNGAIIYAKIRSIACSILKLEGESDL